MPTNRVAELQLRGRAGTLQGRVYWPGPVAAGQARLLVYLATPDTGAWCQELSARTGLVVLSVPAGCLDDAIAAIEWAAEHMAALGARSGQLLIGGTGEGGALAATVALHVHAAGWPPLSRQVLIRASPLTVSPLSGVAPATVVTAEHDPGGDEGRYAAALREAGVAVDEIRCPAGTTLSRLEELLR